jgi:putative hydrolase of the HAD superfamily
MIARGIPYDNFIFDVGNVLLRWSPRQILETVLPGDPNNPTYLQEIFKHAQYLDIDKGVLDEEAAIPLFRERTKLSAETLRRIFLQAKESLTPMEDSLLLLKTLSSMNKNLYCLSNMSAATYDHVRHFDFWSEFKGVVISGHVRLVKPEKEIFEFTLNKFGLRAERSIFIDDTPQNVEAARRLGIKSILFTEAEDCSRQLNSL